VILTKREIEILSRMRDAAPGSDDSELVFDGGRVAWLGLDHVATRTLYKFLRLAAISADPLSRGGGRGDVERYHLNDTGRGLLEGKAPLEALSLDMVKRGYR
jgi:hypothetical protein